MLPSAKRNRRISNFRMLTILCFIVISILYYFLRFQFDLDGAVISLYVILQTLICLVVVVSFFQRNAVRVYLTGSIDRLLLFATFHAFYLLAVTIVRNPASEALFYSVKDFIFPVMIYWYCRYSARAIDFEFMYKFIVGVMTIVALIYIAEFVDKVILGNPLFAYSQKVRELIMEKTVQSSISGTVIVGDLYTFVRLDGPLSHNNVTGLGMALGALGSIILAVEKKGKIFVLALVVNLFGLLLAIPRTAILSLLVAGGSYLWLRRSKLGVIESMGQRSFSVRLEPVERLAGAGSRGSTISPRTEDSPHFRLHPSKFGIRTIFNILFSFSLVLWMFLTETLDISSYSNLLGYESTFVAGWNVLTNNQEITALMGSLLNPISWFGLGYPIPGDFSDEFNIVRSDDLFFLQLVSMYGFVGVAILLSGVWTVFKLVVKNRGGGIWVAYYLGISFCVAMIISTLHTNALIRPQLFPLFFISLAALAAYSESIATPVPTATLNSLTAARFGGGCADIPSASD